MTSALVVGNGGGEDESNSSSSSRSNEWLRFRVVTSWERLAIEKERELRACYKQIDALEDTVETAKQTVVDLGGAVVEADERRKREKRELAEKLTADSEVRLQDECALRGRTAKALEEAQRKIAQQEEELARLGTALKQRPRRSQRQTKKDDDGNGETMRWRDKYNRELMRRKELEDIHLAALAQQRELNLRIGQLEVSNEALEREVEAAEEHYAKLSKASGDNAMRTQAQMFALKTALFVLGAELKDEELVARLLMEAGLIVDREKKNRENVEQEK
jgi:hypothetical protein